jgi:hypothetical protein
LYRGCSAGPVAGNPVRPPRLAAPPCSEAPDATGFGRAEHQVRTSTTWNIEGGNMRKLWILALAVLAVAIAAAGADAVTKPIAFTAKYSGMATTQAADNVVTINANGTGKALLLGAGKITGAGTADSSQRPCVPFTGTGKVSGPGGILIFKVKPGSSGCGDEAGQVFSISGKATVLKATGKLAKRKGTLKLSGIYDRGSGAFTIKLTGSLAY